MLKLQISPLTSLSSGISLTWHMLEFSPNGVRLTENPEGTAQSPDNNDVTTAVVEPGSIEYTKSNLGYRRNYSSSYERHSRLPRLRH